MKVNIDKTLEVSDEQRKAIALHFDGPGSKKRDATRDEMKEFIWDNGSSWEDVLENPSATSVAQPIVPVTGSGAEHLGNIDVIHVDPEDLDLIGGGDVEPDEEDLI